MVYKYTIIAFNSQIKIIQRLLSLIPTQVIASCFSVAFLVTITALKPDLFKDEQIARPIKPDPPPDKNKE